MSCKCTKDVMTMTDAGYAPVTDYEQHRSILPNFRRFANRNAGLCLPCFRNSGPPGESAIYTYIF